MLEDENLDKNKKRTSLNEVKHQQFVTEQEKQDAIKAFE